MREIGMPCEKDRILLVEDEAFNIRVLLDLLKPKYEVIVAKDGEQVLKRLRTSLLPDLVLLDILLPGLDGYAVCRELKKDDSTRDIPVVFMTAKKSPDDVLKGFQLGAVDYVVKPINYMELLNRLKTHLKLRRTARELEASLERIRTLRGFLPVCSHCKRVRNDKGFWESIEKYIGENTEIDFEYSLCPRCGGTSYPDDVFRENGDREDESKRHDREIILIAEDERFNLNVLVETLRGDYELLVAKDGRKAVRRAHLPPGPDLILMDVMMPEMDGLEACCKLKEDEDTRDIPVIFMTVKRETDDILRAFDCGAVDYMIKPINYMELSVRVKTHLTLKRKLNQLKKTLKEVETLKGLFPVCPKCKRVRDDKGYWDRIDHYFSRKSLVEFTHGICPECARSNFPDLYEKISRAKSGGGKGA